MSVPVVKIKNINSSYKFKKFAVRGRIKPHPCVQNNLSGNGKHLDAILYDKTSSIHLVAFDNDCDKMLRQLEAFKLISIENIEIQEVKKIYSKITNHKYNLVLKSCKTIIKDINNIGLSIIDYPKYPVFSKNLTTLKSETVVDVFGEFTEIGHVDGTNTFRYGKVKVESSEISVKFFGDKINKVYDIGRPLIIYTAKLKFYQGNYCLNISNLSHIEYSPSLNELNVQSSSPHVARSTQTVAENLVQISVLPNNGNVVQDMTSGLNQTMPSTSNPQSNLDMTSRLNQTMPSTSNPQSNLESRQSCGNKVTKASRSETIPVQESTPDAKLIHQLLYHINRHSEADKIQIRQEIINFVKNYQSNQNGV